VVALAYFMLRTSPAGGRWPRCSAVTSRGVFAANIAKLPGCYGCR
jgi:hypothetical protein